MRDLKLPTLGTPDPLSTEEESLLAVMASHPFDRFCVLLCGAAGFVRMIDRKQLPFVQVGRVRIGAQRPVCSLFPQLLPPARAAADEPLLTGPAACFPSSGTKAGVEPHTAARTSAAPAKTRTSPPPRLCPLPRKSAAAQNG